MKLIRCFSAFCARTYLCSSSGVFPKRFRGNMIADFSKLLTAPNRREIHKCSVAFLDVPNLSETEIFEDLTSLNMKPDKREEVIHGIVDEWFSEFLQKLSTPGASLDWESEFQNKPRNFPFMIMSKIVSSQNYYEGMYQNGISLMEYLQSQMGNNSISSFGNTDIIFLINKISLVVHQKRDHSLAIELYKDLCKKVTNDGELLLDVNSCFNLVSALSKTKHWKECLRLLEAATLTSSNSSLMCSNILKAAMRENDDEVSKKMLDMIEDQDDLPSVGAFKAIVLHRPPSYLMTMLSDRRMVIKESMADIIKEFYEKFATVEKVDLDQRFCSSCGNSLPPGQNIPAKEMDELADTFSKKVFIRNNDAFINSDPEEVGNFKAFLASRPKYDVVVDAMNVLFRKRNSTFAEKDWILLNVIKYFSKNGKRVLVLCRSHLEKSLKSQKKLREQQPDASVDWFFLKNQTQDDLFLLYASLHGNHGCIIVTRDELRDHRYLLGPEQARVFKRWQQKHQVIFEGMDKKLIFKWPPKHDVVTQKARDGTIHIPYMDESLEHTSFSHTNSWLCIRGIILDNKY